MSACSGEHRSASTRRSPTELAFIAAGTFAMEAVVELSSSLADEEHNDVRIEAAMAKLFCSEMAWLVADEMVQVKGRPRVRDGGVSTSQG